MLRRNRKVNDDDDERVLPSVTLLPALQQQYKKPRRRKRRYDNNRIQNLLLDIFLCCLLAVGLYLAPSRIYRNSTIFRSHKRIVSDDSIQKRFNQSTDCPLDPVPGEYPIEFNLVRMLEAWPVDDISNHDGNTFQSLCVFDWNQDREKIDRYRQLELPFIIAGDPQVEEATHRWNQPGYLVNMLGPDTKYSTDYSTTNHYIYVNQILKARYKGSQQRRMRKGRAGNELDYDAAATMTNNTKIQMTYPEWLEIAQENENVIAPTQPHWYFQFMTCGTYDKGECKSNANITTSRLTTLGSELPFLSDPDSFYIIEPEQQKGRIQCKFGMAGITSQAHFDTPRNFLVLLGGKRRYILLHPRNYANLYMFPGDHPSARHSAVNWSAPDLVQHPMFAQARATEAVLKQGEVLYIPPKWIHSIVSLTTSMQCNAWSGSKNQR